MTFENSRESRLRNLVSLSAGPSVSSSVCNAFVEYRRAGERLTSCTWACFEFDIIRAIKYIYIYSLHFRQLVNDTRLMLRDRVKLDSSKNVY